MTTSTIPPRRTNRIVRTQIRELLSVNSNVGGWSRPEQNKLLRDTAAVVCFLADGGGLNRHLDLRLSEIREANEPAAGLSSRVDFPGFVAGLIHGVFNSTLTSSVEQMRAYAELVAAAAEDAANFVNDSTRQSNDYLEPVPQVRGA